MIYVCIYTIYGMHICTHISIYTYVYICAYIYIYIYTDTKPMKTRNLWYLDNHFFRGRKMNNHLSKDIYIHIMENHHQALVQ